MKITNLSNGLIINNYKDLCKLLEIPVKTSNAKLAQLKELSLLCEYTKEGHKFHITEVYLAPKQPAVILSKKVAPYVNNMELLLMNFLVYCGNSLIISNSGLYNIMNMVNKNYSLYQGVNKKVLAKTQAIDILDVNEFYKVSSEMFIKSILTTLDRLKRNRLIFHQKVKVVARIVSVGELNTETKHDSNLIVDDEGFEHITYTPEIHTRLVKEEADDATIKAVMKIEREILVSMGLNQDTKANYLHYVQRYAEFIQKVNKRLVKELNIAYSYEAYKILFNYEDVVETRDKLLDHLLPNDIKQQLMKDTNSQIIAHIKKKKINFIGNYDHSILLENFIQELIENE